MIGKNNYNKLYTVLTCLGVFTFCTCCILEVVCLFRTLSIPDDLVSVWRYTILVLFGFKLYHAVEGGWGWYGIVVLEV